MKKKKPVEKKKYFWFRSSENILYKYVRYEHMSSTLEYINMNVNNKFSANQIMNWIWLTFLHKYTYTRMHSTAIAGFNLLII